MLLKLSSILKRPERIFLIVGSFFGLISLFLMPVLTIPDEGAHFWMSYGMFSKNQQIPRDLMISAEDSAGYIKDGTYIEKIFKDKVNLEGDGFQFRITKEIKLNSLNEDRPVSSLDISRWPQAIGIAIGRAIHPSIGVMATLGRLLNFAVFFAALYLIIKHVKYGKLAFTFLALFPMIVHQAASLSYDAVNIVVIFAWVAYMINLFTQKTPITRSQIIKLPLLAAALIVTKPSNVLLLALLPFLPKSLYSNSRIFTKVHKKITSFKVSKRFLKLSLWSLSAIGLGAILFLGDAYLAKYGISSMQFIEVLFNTFFRTELNTQLDPIVTSGIVGHFGWLWYKLPEWLVIIHLGIFGLILLGERVPKVSLRLAIVSASLFLVSVFAITLGMYTMWTLRPNIAGIDATFIQGMQGRYFTPLLVLLIPVFAYIQQYISVKIKPRLLSIVTVSMAVFSLTVYLLLTYIFFYRAG